jgi:hypothetical protein
MAHYSHDSSLHRFPYRHTKFVFDAPRRDLEISTKLLQQTGARLQDATVLAVRNGTVHPRERFPSRSDVLKFCSVISGTVEPLELAGLFPIIYGTVCVETDSFGRESVTSRRLLKNHCPSTGEAW